MSMQFVAYYRVSTRKQGRSGLGLEAQKEAVSRHLKTSGGKLVASFQEVESGKNNNRIQLHYALEEARKHRATVIIAKLDRLGRRASYILRLIDELHTTSISELSFKTDTSRTYRLFKRPPETRSTM